MKNREFHVETLTPVNDTRNTRW